MHHQATAQRGWQRAQRAQRAQRPRARALAAAVALLTLLTTLLSMAPAARADDGQASLRYVPRETMLVLSIDVASLRATPLYRRVLERALAAPGRREVLTQLEQGTGFTLERDLEGLVLALPDDIERTQNFLLIARGAFDEARFIAFARSRGGALTTSTHRDHQIHALDRQAAVSFTEDHLIIGTPFSVRAAIDTIESSLRGLDEHALMQDLIGQADTARPIWLAFVPPLALRESLAGSGALIEDMTGASASLALDPTLGADLEVRAADAASAQGLEALARTFLQQSAADPSFEALGLNLAFAHAEVSREDATVRVALRVEGQARQRLEGALLTLLDALR